MDSILLIFVCLLLGFFLQKVKDFPPHSYKTLNQFVIYVALPALTLYYVPKIKIDSQLLFPLGVSWLGFLFSALFFYSIGHKFGWSKKLIGCLILTAGLGNTSFIGFPIIEALYGEEGLKTAIMVDQPGTFVVLATLGIATAAFFSKGKATVQQMVSKIVFFPPFIAFIVACFLNLFQLHLPIELQTVFQKMGGTVIPIALISVGLQLKIERRSRHWQFLTLGLLFKLIITPAIFFLIYKIGLQKNEMVVDVSIMESGMAPMITGAILASTYGLKPKLSTMMIGVGIPISFITLAFWYFILNTFR